MWKRPNDDWPSERLKWQITPLVISDGTKRILIKCKSEWNSSNSLICSFKMWYNVGFFPFFEIGNTSIKGPQMRADIIASQALIKRADEPTLRQFAPFHPLKNWNFHFFFFFVHHTHMAKCTGSTLKIYSAHWRLDGCIMDFNSYRWLCCLCRGAGGEKKKIIHRLRVWRIRETEAEQEGDGALPLTGRTWKYSVRWSGAVVTVMASAGCLFCEGAVISVCSFGHHKAASTMLNVQKGGS